MACKYVDFRLRVWQIQSEVPPSGVANEDRDCRLRVWQMQCDVPPSGVANEDRECRLWVWHVLKPTILVTLAETL